MKRIFPFECQRYERLTPLKCIIITLIIIVLSIIEYQKAEEGFIIAGILQNMNKSNSKLLKLEEESSYGNIPEELLTA